MGAAMNELDVLKNDFDSALSCFDFSKGYNPLDHRFLSTLAAGLMYLAIKTTKADDDVSEELSGAEKYFELYKQTSDNSYKEMANDELRHAGVLIKKHLASADDTIKKAKLEEQEAVRLNMLKTISTATLPIKELNTVSVI